MASADARESFGMRESTDAVGSDRAGARAHAAPTGIHKASLYFALGRFATKIEHVGVRLSDVNGPRGGVDKECRVRIRLHGLRVVLVTDVDAELRAAVDRACERAGRAVARRVDRLAWSR